MHKGRFVMVHTYPLICTLPFSEEVTKHLLYYVLPLGGDHEWVLDKNIKKICEGLDQFNGKRIVTIAVRGAGDPNYNYISPDAIINKFNRAYGQDPQIDFLIVTNQRKLWEVSGFLPMLSQVISPDPNHVFFYGHCKGVTHPDHSLICHKWADCMYETVYNNWSQVKTLLEQFATVGSFKSYGEFKTPGNHQWYYSGTFYWVRSASAFVRNWMRVDQIFYGTESWPGLHFKPDEGACIIGDGIADMYKKSSAELEQLLVDWRSAKLNNEFCFKNPIDYLQELVTKQYPCILQH